MLNNHQTTSDFSTTVTDSANEVDFREMTEEDQKASHPIPDLASLGITPDLVRQRFKDALYFVRDHIDEYVVNPGVDFTRNSTFNSVTLMTFLILMGGGSSICEINKFFSMDKYELPPHNSSFCEARKKLLPQALYAVFQHFMNSFPELRTLKGYRLIGVDGSTINIPLNKNEPQTLHQNKEDQKCFSQCYFNGAYDLINAVYVDTLISTLKKTDERSALLTIACRSSLPLKSILVGDRGYGGWKVFATLINLNRKFVIREKDVDKQGIMRGLDLPEDEEFDVVKTFYLTNKQTKETLSNPDKFRIIMSNQDFPFLDKDNHYYAITLRFVRIKVAPGKYICLITNLIDQKEITTEDLKYIYFLRWGQEGSYRVFKYTIGVLHFHAKQYMKVQQEIYAKMIEFNVCQLIAGCVSMDDDSNNMRVLTQEEYIETCKMLEDKASASESEEDTEVEEIEDTEEPGKKKYRYKPNLSAAITNIKDFLKGIGDSETLILRIKRYLIPIRPGRSFSRNVKPQSATTLLYRAS